MRSVQGCQVTVAVGGDIWVKILTSKKRCGTFPLTTLPIAHGSRCAIGWVNHLCGTSLHGQLKYWHGIKFGGFSENCQTAKFKTPPTFSTIW